MGYIKLILMTSIVLSSCSKDMTDHLVETCINKISQKLSINLSNMTTYTSKSTIINHKLIFNDIEKIYLNDKMKQSVEISIGLNRGEIDANNNYTGKLLKIRNQVFSQMILSTILEEIPEFILIDDSDRKIDPKLYEGYKLYKQTINANYFEIIDIFESAEKQVVQDNVIGTIQYQLYKFEQNKLYIIPASFIAEKKFQSYMIIKEFTKE